jgi:serine/threonine protein kinase
MVVIDLKDRVLNNRYKLLHPLGKGGMALVFESYDQLLERPVAIKLLRKDFSSIPGFRERFLQEARSAANLTHPNIVTIYDFGIDTGEIFIVMELASGLDLKTTIQSNGPYPIAEGLDLAIQICSGLGYAHRAGIVHCDVKPQNIIITKDHISKITDFGIARALNSTNLHEDQEVIWGSPQYMAPEMIEGFSPSPASDVYSIGAVLYEMFSGNPPYNGENIEELLSQQQNNSPAPLTNIRDLPDELNQVILKTLSKETALRYRTADQLGNVLLLIQKRLTDNTNNITTNYVRRVLPPVYLPPPISYEDNPDLEITRNTVDWSMIGIELLCLLLVGGLIPFWIFVWFTIKPLMG